MEASGECHLQSRLEAERALATIGTSGNGFATLVRASGEFFQAAGTVANGFVVEYRDDPGGPHWQSTRKDISRPEVIDLFLSYFDGTGVWKRSLEWCPLDDRVRGDRDTPGTWAPLLLLLVGAALLCLAAHAGYRAQEVSTHLGHASGALVSSRNCGKGRVCIIVQYSVDGRTHFLDEMVSKRTLQSGRLVVFYDARNAEEACVGGPDCVWYRFQGFSVLGGLLVIASGAFYLKTRKTLKAQKPKETETRSESSRRDR